MSSFLVDLRYSLRAIRRSPLFASLTIFSLALGIGANTAMFTLVDQLMLRQLPVKTLGKQLDKTLLTERLVTLLSAGFGLVAPVLAGIAYTV